MKKLRFSKWMIVQSVFLGLFSISALADNQAERLIGKYRFGECITADIYREITGPFAGKIMMERGRLNIEGCDLKDQGNRYILVADDVQSLNAQVRGRAFVAYSPGEPTTEAFTFVGNADGFHFSGRPSWTYGGEEGDFEPSIQSQIFVNIDDPIQVACQYLSVNSAPIQLDCVRFDKMQETGHKRTYIFGRRSRSEDPLQVREVFGLSAKGRDRIANGSRTSFSIPISPGEPDMTFNLDTESERETLANLHLSIPNFGTFDLESQSGYSGVYKEIRNHVLSVLLKSK